MSSPTVLAVASGLALGLRLIDALGAQIAFVLRQGLRLEHVGAVVAVCAASDLALIGAGVLGAGAAFTRLPWLVPVGCLAGAGLPRCVGCVACPLRRPRPRPPPPPPCRAGGAPAAGRCGRGCCCPRPA